MNVAVEPIIYRSDPFKKAIEKPKRRKLFFFGESGAGKTMLALHFPAPCLIDLEGGSDLYGGINCICHNKPLAFNVLDAATPDEIMAAVDWLLIEKHPYKTLIIDPITVYWEALQEKWSDIFIARKQTSKGYKHEFYELQPRDWATIKSEFKELMRKVTMLDMSVIAIARMKPKYKEGTMMEVIGETFDCEKSMPYLFDSVMQMYLNGQGKRMLTVLKDRTGHLPNEPFEARYELFEAVFGKEAFETPAKPQDVPKEPIKPKSEIIANITLPGQQPAPQKDLRHEIKWRLDEITQGNAREAGDLLAELSAFDGVSKDGKPFHFNGWRDADKITEAALKAVYGKVSGYHEQWRAKDDVPDAGAEQG